jgi:hypothetical protein
MIHRIPVRSLRAFVLGILVGPLLANHGPGTSGGGSSTASGETLKAGGFDFSLRTDLTQYQSFTRPEAANRAIQNGDFDAIDRTFVESFSVAYGVTDDFQIGAQLGWYAGDNFVSAEADGMGGADVATADPRGLTDLWLQGKLRVMHGRSGHLAVIAGLKLPTGKDDVLLSNGDPLEPSSQPGTGAVDVQAGLAYSRFLTSRVTMDASGIYTLRTEHEGFRVGDRFDVGTAFAYRLTEDIRQYPNWSVSGEVLGVWLGEDEDGGTRNGNSGGTTVYLAPGIRGRFDSHVALSVAPAVPVYQDLDGDQPETRGKLTVTLSVSF